MRLRYVCTALILGGCTLAGSAQTGSTSAKVAAGTQMSPVQAQEELLNLFEQEFMGVAQAMPADKYGFAPTAATFAASQGAKYDGVRTFAPGNIACHDGELLLRFKDSRGEDAG